MSNPRWTSPMEAVHAARDALDFAAAEQARMENPQTGELTAYGSALVSAIRSMGELAKVLTNQVAEYDTKQIEQEAKKAESVEKHEQALRHLASLCSDLTTASAEANQYWSAASDLHDDVGSVSVEKP